MFGTYKQVLSLIAIILCLSSIVFAYSGGTGEPNDPYQISSVADMQQLSNSSSDWNKNFIMTADVNLAFTFFMSISYNAPFTGIFDGNNHTISNLRVPLFVYIRNGQVRNLGIVQTAVNEHYAAGLVFLNEGGTIINCYASGTINGSDYAGGIVGNNIG